MKEEQYRAELAIELEQSLWLASDSYIQGRINADKLEEIEGPMVWELKEATSAAAKQCYFEIIKRRIILGILTLEVFLSIVLSVVFILLTRNAFFLLLPFTSILTIHRLVNCLENKRFIVHYSSLLVDSFSSREI